MSILFYFSNTALVSNVYSKLDFKRESYNNDSQTVLNEKTSEII